MNFINKRKNNKEMDLMNLYNYGLSIEDSQILNKNGEIGIKTLDDNIHYLDKTNVNQMLYFLKGIFDGYGITGFSSENGNKYPICFISVTNDTILNLFIEYFNIDCEKEKQKIIYKGINCFDFLSKLYENTIQNRLYLSNFDFYCHLFQTKFSKIPTAKFFKTRKDAIIPFKPRASDVGWDLTIIDEVKKYGEKITMYETGIKVVPPYGYYFQIVPRSSLIKSGYMLTNSVGIIDPSFLGSLKVVLTKIDDTLPNLKLPFRCVQLILVKHEHARMVEVSNEDDLGSTTRGSGEFGSTN